MSFYVLSFSSEMYPLWAKDLIDLPDANIPYQSKDDVPILLLGGNAYVKQDCLLSGRTTIQQAIKNKQKTVPVRVAFSVPVKIGAAFALLKLIRYKWKTNGTKTYHVAPEFLRESGLERIQRNATNAYQLTSKKHPFNPTQQRERYQKLVQDMKAGYNDKFPMRAMLCRTNGIKDTLDDGHHRLSICIDNHVPFVTLQFCYASSWEAIRKIFLLRCKKWHKKSNS